MLTSIFILVLNNGQSYEDFDKWNAGIYPSLESARIGALKFPASNNGYDVEEWNVEGQVKSYECYK